MTTGNSEVISGQQQELQTAREEAAREEAGTIAVSLPPTPPDPRVVAAKFKAEREAKVELTQRLDRYTDLEPKEQFDTAIEAGLIPEGSEFVAGLDIDWSKSGLSPEQIAEHEARMTKVVSRPATGWAYYDPEQVAEIKTAEVEAKAVIESRVRAREVGVDIAGRELAEFEAAHTKLPRAPGDTEDKWISNAQLGEIKETSPDIYTILITQGTEAANKVIQERNAEIQRQQDAVRQLDVDYRVAIPPDLPEGIDAVTGARIKFGHNVVGYLRDNPGQTALLITAGYDADLIAKLDKATKATTKYWTPDNKLDVYAAYIGGIDPEHLETLTGQKEEDIKGIAPSYREFLRSYETTTPKPESIWLGTYPGEQGQREKEIVEWTKEADKRYEELYGGGSALLAKSRVMAAGLFAPARVLEPRVEWKDIRTIEWIIGGAQVALYTAPFWIPQVAKVLKPLSKIERAARTAGNSRLRVNIAREEMLARAWNDPSYVRFASNLQRQVQASMKADKVFLDKLAALNRISPQQLTSVEKLSGIKGLGTAIKDVGISRLAVANAWKIIDKSKYYTNPTTQAQIIANENYLTRLGVLQTAQNNLASALAKASGKMTPTYQLAPMAGWNNVISNTEREIRVLQAELAKAEVTMSKAALPTTRTEVQQYWLEIRGQLANAQNRLTGYRTASVAGKAPPDIAKYMVITQTPTQARIAATDKMLKQIDDWLKGEGAYKPVVSPESTAGTSRVATAVRTSDKITVPKTIPKTKLIPVAKPVTKRVAIKAPPITAPAEVSVFPGITAPSVRVTTRTATTIVPAEHIGAMTPEQAQRLYGSEIQIVEAVSPFRITTEAIKPTEWLSPTQAVKEAQRIATQSYVEQIAQSSIRLGEQLKAQGATRDQIQSQVRQSMQNQTRAIEATTLQTQVLQAIQTQTAIQQIISITPITPIIPVTPVTPVTPTTPIVPIIPWLDQPSAFEEKKKEIKPGTITWRQGIFWIIMPPPYDKRFYSKEPPAGAYKFAVGEDSAYKTIQVIGGMPTKDIRDIDIGIAIVTIIRKGKELEIQFKQDVEDAYKGKVVKEKITTVRAPSGVPKFTTESDGSIKLTEKPKVKRQKPIYTPFFSEDTATPPKPKKRELAGVSDDRYYLGHKLPESNVRVEL